MMRRFVFLICAFTSVAAAQSTKTVAHRSTPGTSPAPVTSTAARMPAIAKNAHESVVSIIMSDKNGKPIGQGSGFFVSKDGLIVTNYHVIAEGSSAVAKLPDGAFYAIDGVVAFDKTRDVAVIRAQGRNFRVLTLGDSDKVQVGEEVVAIGNPLSLESTVSNGIVSGIRTVEDQGGKFLQVTAPISPGSSGGPLFNMAGEVVGITTMYLKGGENLNFAIPINDAKHLLTDGSRMVSALPNESESTKTEKHTHPEDATPSVPVAAPNSAPSRRYYQQLYDSGAFTPEEFATGRDGSKMSLGRMPNTDYVCFSDDAHSESFFTFKAWAYDERYAEASDKLMQRNSDDERRKQLDILTATQQSAPYVNFMPNVILTAFAKDAQQFFRGGGRILDETYYQKGVKNNELQYHYDGSSWFYPIPPSDPKAYTRTSKVLHFSIEPTTMRYIESATVTMTVGWGETAATDTQNYGPYGGVCEKVANPKE